MRGTAARPRTAASDGVGLSADLRPIPARRHRPRGRPASVVVPGKGLDLWRATSRPMTGSSSAARTIISIASTRRGKRCSGAFPPSLGSRQGPLFAMVRSFSARAMAVSTGWTRKRGRRSGVFKGRNPRGRVPRSTPHSVHGRRGLFRFGDQPSVMVACAILGFDAKSPMLLRELGLDREPDNGGGWRLSGLSLRSSTRQTRYGHHHFVHFGRAGQTVKYSWRGRAQGQCRNPERVMQRSGVLGVDHANAAGSTHSCDGSWRRSASLASWPCSLRSSTGSVYRATLASLVPRCLIKAQRSRRKRAEAAVNEYAERTFRRELAAAEDEIKHSSRTISRSRPTRPGLGRANPGQGLSAVYHEYCSLQGIEHQESGFRRRSRRGARGSSWKISPPIENPAPMPTSREPVRNW